VCAHLEPVERLAEPLHLGLERGDPLVEAGRGGRRRGRCRLGGGVRGVPWLAGGRRRLVTTQEMAISLLLLAGAARKPLCEVAPGESVERLVDLLHAREDMEPPGALVQLAGRLGPAQHEDAQHGDLVVGEADRLVEELAILGSAAPGTAGEACPAAPGEPLERLVDLPFVVRDDRVAVRGLVAGEPQRVEREWVLVGRRPLFLEQAAEDSQLDGVRVHVRSVRCHVPVNVPFRDSYRVAEGLLAGRYPGSSDPADTARRLARFEAHGVTLYVDLTHPADCLEPYDRLLGQGARRVAHPIVDFGTTTIPHMIRILDDIDAALDAGGSVYVHCWGGIGRTGTAVGCWLVRHGLDGGDPIARIAELRRDMSEAFVASPQTSAQRLMVSAWKRGR
jgi:Swiss Army Knife protein, DSP-PTPase phosphatase domain